MSELYKGIAGSPITYLAGDISAAQTTIAIADDSALPDAPNICTIGYGEHIETIRYGAKSNGVLQQVTRGIEGAPRAWPSGTEVARFFTAYDHLALIEKVTENATNHATHLAENANKHIKESGSNANGRYIKFDDGTITCMMSGTITPTNMVQTSYGLWRFQGDSIPYPATFVEMPWWQMKLQAAEEINVANRSTATTYFNPMLYLSSDKSNVGINYTCIAIGRWK